MRYLLVLISLLAGCKAATEPAPAGPPNIVLVFADDLGYGDLGVYGHPTIRTPHLDQLAAEGVKLTSFYVPAALCSPSRMSLLSGRYPMRAGIPYVLGPDDTTGIRPSEITLAEALKGRGYRTAAFGKWHLGTAPDQLPTANGFDEYYGILYSNDMMPPWVQTERPLRLYRNTEPTDEYPVDQTTLTRRYTEEAVRFIRDAGDDPFFLYLPHAMPHLPIYASAEFAGRSAGGRYGDVIEELDWSVGQLMAALDERGVAENTIVIFTSDNGPWSNMPPRMYDTGIETVQRWDAGSTGPLRGAKGTTWEGGHRVPGIVRFPGRIPPATVSTEMASTIDLFPTLLRLAGAQIPTDRVIDGRDIWTLLADAGPTPHDYLYYAIGERIEAVRDTRWKLRIQGEQAELFDLREDPYERFNVAPAHPEVVNRLTEVIEAEANEHQITNR